MYSHRLIQSLAEAPSVLPGVPPSFPTPLRPSRGPSVLPDASPVIPDIFNRESRIFSQTEPPEGRDRRKRPWITNVGNMIALIFTFCSVLTGFLSSSGFAQTQPPQEQIWDHEVKRWLTPEELGHLEIYFTAEDAAKVMFPDSERIRRETLTLTAEQKSFVEQVIGWEFPEFTFDVFIGETQGNIDGYAIIQNTIGKHRPITYMVGVSSTGECTNFEVLVYREARGNEIATKRFNYQYQGKTIGDPVRINRDIINITGATMSVRSASAGVKRVLVLVNEFYLKPLGLGRDVLAATSKEKGFFEALLGL